MLLLCGFVCLLTKTGPTNLRKQAEDKPDAPNSMNITIIWYLAAIRGETPDKI